MKKSGMKLHNRTQSKSYTKAILKLMDIMEKEFFMKMAKSFMRETLQEEITISSQDIMVKGLFTTKMEIQNVKASGEKTTLNQELCLTKMGQNITKERSIMNTKKMKKPTL